MEAVEQKEKLLNIFKQLSPTSRHEVLDFADYLAHRNKSQERFPQTSIDEAAGCLRYNGPTKSISEMHQAIAAGVRRTWKK